MNSSSKLRGTMSLCYAIGDVISKESESVVFKQLQTSKQPQSVVDDKTTELISQFKLSKPAFEKITEKSIIEAGVPPASLETVITLLLNILDLNGRAVKTSSKKVQTYLPDVWNYINRLINRDVNDIPKAFEIMQREVKTYVNELEKTSAVGFETVARIIAQHFLELLQILHGKIVNAVQLMSKTFVMFLEALKDNKHGSPEYEFAISEGWFFTFSLTNLRRILSQDNITKKAYVTNLATDFVSSVSKITQFIDSIDNKAIKNTITFEFLAPTIFSDKAWTKKHFHWMSETIAGLKMTVYPWFMNFYESISTIIAMWFGDIMLDINIEIGILQSLIYIPDVTRRQKELASKLDDKSIPEDVQQHAVNTFNSSVKLFNDLEAICNHNVQKTGNLLKQTRLASEIASQIFAGKDKIDLEAAEKLIKDRTGFSSIDLFKMVADTDTLLALESQKIKESALESEYVEGKEKYEVELYDEDDESKDDRDIMASNNLDLIENRLATVQEEFEEKTIEFNTFKGVISDKYNRLMLENMDSSKNLSIFVNKKIQAEILARKTFKIDKYIMRIHRLQLSVKGYASNQDFRRKIIYILLFGLFGAAMLYVFWQPIKDYFLAEEITTGLKDSVKAWAGNAWDLGVWGNAQAAGSSVYGFFSGANSAAMKKLITERKIGVGVGITALSFQTILFMGNQIDSLFPNARMEGRLLAKPSTLVKVASGTILATLFQYIDLTAKIDSLWMGNIATVITGLGTVLAATGHPVAVVAGGGLSATGKALSAGSRKLLEGTNVTRPKLQLQFLPSENLDGRHKKAAKIVREKRYLMDADKRVEILDDDPDSTLLGDEDDYIDESQRKKDAKDFLDMFD